MPKRRYYTEAAARDAKLRQMRAWRAVHREERLEHEQSWRTVATRGRPRESVPSPPIHQCLTVLKPHVPGSMALSMIHGWVWR